MPGAYAQPAPNAPVATGSDDVVRAVIPGSYGMPGMSLSWQATRAEAASSGDLGYSMETYELTVDGPDGPDGPDSLPSGRKRS